MQQNPQKYSKVISTAMIQDIHHVEQSKSNSVMQHLSINNTCNHNKTSKINIKFRHDCSLQMAQTQRTIESVCDHDTLDDCSEDGANSNRRVCAR